MSQVLSVPSPLPLVSIENGIPSTTSLKVSEVFSKRHTEVLRGIRELCCNLPESFNGRNFASVEYTDAKGEKRPMYTITRDGFTLLVMGYTGKEAIRFKLAYIEAFNAMEQELLKQKSAMPATLSPANRAELKALVDAKLSACPASIQGKARSELWTRFNRHFRIAEYAQLPAERMAEARDYLVELEIKALKTLPAASPERSPALNFRTDFPADMSTARKNALKKIQSLMTGVSAIREVVRLFCHPGGISTDMPLDEREIYDTLKQLYCAADASLFAAYNVLDAGYRIGKQYGRG